MSWSSLIYPQEHGPLGPARRVAESVRTEGGSDAIPPPNSLGGTGQDGLQGTEDKTGDVSSHGHTARCEQRLHQKPGPLTVQVLLLSPRTTPPPATEVDHETTDDARSFQGQAGSFPKSCPHLPRPSRSATCLNLDEAQQGKTSADALDEPIAFFLQEESLGQKPCCCALWPSPSPC